MNRLTALSLILAAGPLQSDPDLTRIGYARNPDSDQLLYTEHHCESLQGGMILQSIVIYRDSDGSKIAEKTVDFSRNPFLPEFSLVNKVTGHEETTTYGADGYNIRFTSTAENKVSNKPVDVSADAVGDAGFDNFVIAHWQKLIEGEIFSRDFLIPSMQKFLSFRIYQKRIIEENGNRFRELYVEPDNFLLRALSKPLRLIYDFDEPVLRVFRGVSNMRDADGENYNVVIHYQHRKPGRVLEPSTGSLSGADCCLQISAPCQASDIKPEDPDPV